MREAALPVAVAGCVCGEGAESAILRTWPDNDDSGLNDDDDDSEGNVHWPQAESGERERESERSESWASQLVAKIILMTAKRKKL